jgi:hypothetical protein
MTRVLMPLAGSFFRKSEGDDDSEPPTPTFAKLESFIQEAHLTIPLRKKTTSMERRMSILLENTDLKTSFANFKELKGLTPFSD